MRKLIQKQNMWAEAEIRDGEAYHKAQQLQELPKFMTTVGQSAPSKDLLRLFEEYVKKFWVTDIEKNPTEVQQYWGARTALRDELEKRLGVNNEDIKK